MIKGHIFKKCKLTQMYKNRSTFWIRVLNFDTFWFPNILVSMQNKKKIGVFVPKGENLWLSLLIELEAFGLL